MYELPRLGDHYWHDNTGYRVNGLDESADPPRLDLELDREFEEELCGALPDNYIVQGGRRSDDGTWHFEVAGPHGLVGGRAWSVGDNMEQAIREAVAGALQSLS
jgi:hypothetical protein